MNHWTNHNIHGCDSTVPVKRQRDSGDPEVLQVSSQCQDSRDVPRAKETPYEQRRKEVCP